MSEIETIVILDSIRFLALPKDRRTEICNALKIAMHALREKRSIVYCKDCKYLGIKDFVYGYCKRDMNGQVQPDDYCSRGVRRKERHDE